MHLFERFARRKGHYPMFRRKHVVVEVHPGYITFRRRGQLEYQGVYVTRQQAVELLRWLVPLVKQMTESFDVEEAMSDYLKSEQELHEELRRMKKEDRSRRRAMKRRGL
jgi:hypothetical protein